MTRVYEFLISLLIVLALFVVIALFLPDRRVIEHSVETNRSMTTVNDLLTGFTRFNDWNMLTRFDPKVRIDVSGEEHGVGARLEYASDVRVVGNGSWELVEFEPGERIVYQIENDARGSKKSMSFRFERTGQFNRNVKITQRYSVDYGWDLIGRYAGLYVNRNVGDGMKKGLERLSNLLTTIPRFDYGRHPNPFEFVDLPPVHALVASAAARRANDDIALAMTNQRKWIDQVIEKNDLEAAGPMRIVTNEFTGEAYAFDVVVPVRKKGEGGAEETVEADAGEATGETTAEAATEPVSMEALEPLEVKIEGENNPVRYELLPAMRAATTTYVGPSPGLPRVRDLVRAWAMVRGADLSDRPYEDYKVSIPDMLNEDAEFRVYWPLKDPAAEAAKAAALEAAAAAEQSAKEQDGDAAAEPAAEAAEAAPAEAPAQ
ncbi:MAG TPA: SRPBCC family protein [Arenimonas sp.]|nr:SRPBCC family protein [Arenimonas sp.]